MDGLVTGSSHEVSASISVVVLIEIGRSDLGESDSGHDRTDYHQNQSDQTAADTAPEHRLNVADFRVETHRDSLAQY
jgi:hypothetical protein